MQTPFDATAPSTCYCGYGRDCICLPGERALRRAKHGDGPAMTPEQREWCLDEIGRVEGYDRSDYDNESDATVAGAVLSAWTDYCRDKGLL